MFVFAISELMQIVPEIAFLTRKRQKTNFKKIILVHFTRLLVLPGQYLVELQRRRGDMVENGQKLENGVNVLIKSLIVEISP